MIRGGKFKRDVQGRFFIQVVVGAWNELPEVVMEADTTDMLKRLCAGRGD